MADHVVVDRGESGTGTGVMLGILAIVLIGVIALFFVFGGPGRFTGGQTTPQSNTNINVPAQGQQQPAAAPNINIPKEIDVNVNQPGQRAPTP